MSFVTREKKSPRGWELYNVYYVSSTDMQECREDFVNTEKVRYKIFSPHLYPTQEDTKKQRRLYTRINKNVCMRCRQDERIHLWNISSCSHENIDSVYGLFTRKGADDWFGREEEHRWSFYARLEHYPHE